MEIKDCKTLYRVCSKEDNDRIENGLPIISKAEMFPEKAVDVSFAIHVSHASRMSRGTYFISTTTSQKVALDYLMQSDHGEDDYILVIDAEKLFHSGYAYDIHSSSELVGNKNIRADRYGNASQEVAFKGSVPAMCYIAIRKGEILSEAKAIMNEALAMCKTKKNPARAWNQWNYDNAHNDIYTQALNRIIAKKASLTA